MHYSPFDPFFPPPTSQYHTVPSTPLHSSLTCCFSPPSMMSSRPLQFTTVETVLTGIMDEWPQHRKRKTLIILAICVCLFLVGLPLVTEVRLLDSRLSFPIYSVTVGFKLSHSFHDFFVHVFFFLNWIKKKNLTWITACGAYIV